MAAVSEGNEKYRLFIFPIPKGEGPAGQRKYFHSCGNRAAFCGIIKKIFSPIVTKENEMDLSLLPEMTKIALYVLAVFISNIVQALTGFAGMMLAMPPIMLLYGPDRAKALLTLLTWLVALRVLFRDWRFVNRKEIGKIVGSMFIGMILGMYLYRILDASFLVPLYGMIIVLVALKNMIFRKSTKPLPLVPGILILLGSGVIHGMFASGGALLVVYLLATFHDKDEFRANVSTIWAITDLPLFASDWAHGYYTAEFWQLFALGLLPLFFAAWLGNKLHDRINQKMFTRLTYVLLLCSGAMILI